MKKMELLLKPVSSLIRHRSPIFSAFVREKSTTVGAYEGSNEFSSDNAMKLKKIYTELRYVLYSETDSSISKGEEKLENYEYDDAIKEFDVAISLAAGEEDDLSNHEKASLARAYAYKGVALSYGNSNELEMAKVYLRKALELNPNEIIAIDRISHIEADSSVPPHYDMDDEKKDVSFHM